MEIKTYLDLLYIALSISSLVVAVFLSIVLMRLYKILWHAENISKAISSLIDMANDFMVKPIHLLNLVLDFVWKSLSKK